MINQNEQNNNVDVRIDEGYVEFFYVDDNALICDYQKSEFGEMLFNHLSEKTWFTKELELKTRNLVKG